MYRCSWGTGGGRRCAGDLLKRQPWVMARPCPRHEKVEPASPGPARADAVPRTLLVMGVATFTSAGVLA